MAITQTAAVPCDVNLVPNFGFEFGNVGFANGYSFFPSQGTLVDAVTNPLITECRCSILDRTLYPRSNATTFHPSWSPCLPRHGARALICNGCYNFTAFQYEVVWASDMSYDVVRGANYSASFYASSIFFIALIQMKLQYCAGNVTTCPLFGNVSTWVDVGTVAPIINQTTITAQQVCNYSMGTGFFTTAAGTTQIWLRILDVSTANAGNDFLLDDINLMQTCAPTASSDATLTLTPTSTATSTLTSPSSSSTT